jgi:hypothetical protein
MAGNCIFVVKFGGKLDRQSSTWNFWREIGPSGHEKIGGKLDLVVGQIWRETGSSATANLAGNWIFGGNFGGKSTWELVPYHLHDDVSHAAEPAVFLTLFVHHSTKTTHENPPHHIQLFPFSFLPLHAPSTPTPPTTDDGDDDAI